VTQRVCFILRVDPDRLGEYRERHRSVWPEMQDALRETGWQNYSLFLRDDGTLVGYLECEDFERSRALMAETDVNGRWQQEMQDFFIAEDHRLPDEQMAPIPEVFHLP